MKNIYCFFSFKMIICFCLLISGTPRLLAGTENYIQILHDQSKDTFKRIEAANYLGNIADKKSVHALIKAFKGDSEVLVRMTAGESLGKIGDMEAVESLTAALKEDKWVIRRSAVSALGRFRNTEVNASLISVLKEDGNPFVRAEAAKSLGMIGHKSAVSVLKKALKDTAIVPNIKDGKIVEVKRVVAEAANAALKELGEKTNPDILDFDWVKDAIQCLEDNRNFEKNVRSNAAWMIGLSGDKRAFQPLMNAASDEESQVRRAAVRALSDFGDIKAFDLLVNLMFNDTVRWIRNDAARALAKISGKRAEVQIRKALADGKISAKTAEDVFKKLNLNFEK